MLFRADLYWGWPLLCNQTTNYMRTIQFLLILLAMLTLASCGTNPDGTKPAVVQKLVYYSGQWIRDEGMFSRRIDTMYAVGDTIQISPTVLHIVRKD